MRLRPVLPLVALLLLAPIAFAQQAAPEGATRFVVGDHVAWHWVGEANATLAEMEPGASAPIRLLVDLQAPANGSLWVNLSSASFTFTNASWREDLAEGNGTRAFEAQLTLGANASGTASYNVTVEILAVDAEGNVTQASKAGSAGAITIPAPVIPTPPAEEPGFPLVWALGGAAVVVAVGGGYALYLRAERRRMNAAPRRSQVMREMELERRLEKASEKDPEQAAVIKQEIRAQEQVREKRRELQILEARRADAQKTLDLLRKRHEAGGLTKLQYDNMAAKKQADLARIEAEIAAMESGEGGSGAAA